MNESTFRPGYFSPITGRSCELVTKRNTNMAPYTVCNNSRKRSQCRVLSALGTRRFIDTYYVNADIDTNAWSVILS